MNSQSEKYMQLALKLAALGNPSPNPYVGCVIVKNDEIIGKGYHRQAGAPHAEVNAITKVTAFKEKVKTIVLVADGASFTPCGSCLDWLLQFSTKDAILITQNGKKKIRRYRLKDLYPRYPKR